MSLLIEKLKLLNKYKFVHFKGHLYTSCLLINEIKDVDILTIHTEKSRISVDDITEPLEEFSVFHPNFRYEFV